MAFLAPAFLFLAALAGVTLHPEAPTSGVFRADLAHRVAVAQGLV